MEKFFKNKWLIFLSFLILTATVLVVVSISLTFMNSMSTIKFYSGFVCLIMAILVYLFWLYIMFNQLILIIKEEKLLKKYKNKKNE